MDRYKAAQKQYAVYLTRGVKNGTEKLTSWLTGWKVFMTMCSLFLTVASISSIANILQEDVLRTTDDEYGVKLRWWILAIAVVMFIGGMFLDIYIRHKSEKRFLERLEDKDQKTLQLERTYWELTDKLAEVSKKISEQEALIHSDEVEKYDDEFDDIALEIHLRSEDLNQEML